MDNSRSVIIIGAGIAGLSAGVYAQRNGYHSQIFEMHDLPGGLMTAWKRRGYTIDGCIHWLTGSRPGGNYYTLWEQIGLIQDRKIFDPEVFMHFEGRQGQVLTFYSDIDRLEGHLLEIAPEDREWIHDFCGAAKSMVDFDPPVSASGSLFTRIAATLRQMPKMLSLMPSLRKWSGMSMADFSAHFKNPFLREVFSTIWYPEMSAGALVFTMSFLHGKNAGYPLGGSLPMAHDVEKRYCELGGVIHYAAQVEKILIEPLQDGKGDRAVGVRLTDGSEHRAEYVISAADGHATIFDMLDGRYLDDKIRKVYAEYQLFPPIVLVGFGVNRTFPELPCATGGISLPLDQPIVVAGESVDRLDMMVYNFDPSLSPAGKTVLTVTISTQYTPWKELSGDDERYEAEKKNIGIQLIDRLDRRFPGFSGQVEMVNVATPMTFERYTGNWQASFEGFLAHTPNHDEIYPQISARAEEFLHGWAVGASRWRTA